MLAAGRAPGGWPRLARLLGLATSALTLLLSLVAAVRSTTAGAGRSSASTTPWAASIGLRFHLGVDGISLPLVVLTAALTFLCMVYTARVPARRARGGHPVAARAGRR